MAVDIFAKIGDIKGESQDGKYKDHIEVLSWSWGLTQPGTMGVGSGGGKGKVSFQEFNFTHALDAASPNLFKACAVGKHYPDGIVINRKAGEKPLDYMVFKFMDVFVTNVAPAGSQGGDVMESVSLQFGKVEVEYKTQMKDGTAGASVFFKYDVVKGESY